MRAIELKRFQRARRQKRVRNRVTGTPQRPRLSVFRSLKQIYAQVIDDTTGRTLVAASTRAKEVAGQVKSTGNKIAAKTVGKALAEAAIKKGIVQVVFDRSGYRYHGRIAALAEGAREGGLKF